MKTQAMTFDKGKRAHLYNRLVAVAAVLFSGWAMLSPNVAYTAFQSGGSLQFLSETLAINEVNGTVSLAVTRAGSAAGAVSVQYTTAGGTATLGADFTTPGTDFISTSGTLSFADGETTKTITVPINADSTTEPDETFTVSLSGATGGATLGTPSTVTVTIVDPRSTTQSGRLLTSPRGIVEFNTDGSNTVNLTANSTETQCAPTGAHTDSHPSVSRDGRLIAFSSNRDGTGYRIFVMSHDGTHLRQVTLNPGPNPNQADDVDQDVNPMISPDGTRVAFISGRTVLDSGPCKGSRVADIWVVNTDGTGLRRVTAPQSVEHSGGGCGGVSGIRSVVWSPDGTRLAFRGARQPIVDGQLQREIHPHVVGRIGESGGAETTVAVHPTTGASEAIDWSPDGTKIGLIWGGEAQGAPARRVRIYDSETIHDPRVEEGGSGTLIGENLVDIFRFSPDSQGFVVGIITDFNSGAGVLRFINVAGRTDIPRPNHSLGTPIWWQPGAPVPAPARFEIAPDPVVVYGGHSVQVMPTLSEANGNTIVRAATAWRLDNCFSGNQLRISHTGVVTGTPDANFTGQVCASNGELSDCSTLQNSDIPILSVSATKPEANRSGAGAPATFVIARGAGNPSDALVVSFALSDSAVRDADYTLDATDGTVSGNTVTMPPNQSSVTINVRPVAGAPGAGDKSVILTLLADPANAYLLSEGSKSARVFIRDDVNPRPSCAPTPPGLAHWYRGEDAADDFAGTQHGTLRGGAAFAQGRVGQAFSLDGVDDDVDLGTLSPGSKWTVEAWVRPSSLPSGRRAILGGFAECNDWGLTMEGGQYGVLVKPPTGCTQTISAAGAAAQAGEWAHVVATSDGATARLYVNGVERASGAVAADYVGYAGSVRVGSEACCGNHFPGLIDEASIYGRALSPSEVQALFQAGGGGKCTLAPTPTPTPTPPLSLSAVTPDRGGDTGSVTATVYGGQVKPGASVALRRAGRTDIPGTGASVAPNGTSVTATFDLAGKERGAWDVIVTNPGGVAASLTAAFTVEAGRPLDVWVDLVGRYTIRGGRTQTFYIAYGNKGNTDAPAALVQLFVPSDLSVAELPLGVDGVGVSTINEAGDTIVQLYVPRLPAGASYFAPVRLTTPPELSHQSVELEVNIISSEGLDEDFNVPPADSTVTITPTVTLLEPGHVKLNARVTNGAGEIEDYEFDHTYGPATDDEGVQVSVVEVGDRLEYNIRATVPDATRSPPPTAQSLREARQINPPVRPSTTHQVKVKAPKHLFATPYTPRTHRLRDSLEAKLLRCLASKGIIEEFQVEDFNRVDTANQLVVKLGLFAKITKSFGQGQDINSYIQEVQKLQSMLDDEWYHQVIELVARDILFGENSARRYSPALTELVKRAERERTVLRESRVEKVARLNIFLDIIYKCKCDVLNGQGLPAAPSTNIQALASDSREAFDVSACGCFVCKIRAEAQRKRKALLIVFSYDPNDKVGPQGGGAPRYITGVEPLPYTVFFENQPEATAPAQDVVITDQLDTSKFDLSTFQLGAFSFGDRVISPPPGLKAWTTDVDLRPANNLIVRVNAALNTTTGLLQWTFTSLDPMMKFPTEDATAGFLPPNKKSPEGEGSVTYTVSAKPNLAAGAEIRNKARIVFDANAPIDTPEWLNTIDNSKPSSQVAALPATQIALPFNVSWSGADTGSGVGSYSVFVSEDGGPFQLWQEGTAATSAPFEGRAGKSYAFYSVAQDAAGNFEDAPAGADATTATPQCSYTLSAPGQSFGAVGGAGSVTLTTISGCAWTAATGDSWITLTLGAGGTASGTVSFSVAANAGPARTGTLTVAGQTFIVTQAAAPTVQFAAASLNIGEAAGSMAVAVTRSGDASAAASVDYHTADTDTFTVGCADAAGAQGAAFARCDYATSLDTLTFAPGETMKSFTVPIINDAHVEPNETFTLRLSNPSNAVLGTPAIATITIADNDAAGQPNPVLMTPFFVRQQYLDFLSREPEQSEPWSAILNNCPNPFNLDPNSPAAACDRIIVSQSFFGSPEFRLKGFYVFTFYRVAFDRLAEYSEIVANMRAVTGQTPSDTFSRRAQFPVSFTERPEFRARFDALSDGAYVAALLDRYSAQQITTPDPANPEGGTKVMLTRADLVNRLGATGAQRMTRAQVLRAIVESDEVSAAEFFNAFVAMQYYGYLRRTPETAGFQAWLRYLRENPTDSRTMVNGFLNSFEYRLRFGAP